MDAPRSLNPALAETRFCPRCGSPATVHFPKRVSCAHCGFLAYYNPKPVAAAIPTDPDGSVYLLKRAFAPGEGLWTFPGGFVDLGESIEEAAHREIQEEMAIAVELGELVGVYSRADDPVVLVVYAARALGEPAVTTEEALEVRAFAPEALPWDRLAFWSTDRALRDFLSRSPVAGA